MKQGEVLGIIGKNGAGKSTLLKILSKITEPTSGRIEMKGRVAALLEVGTGFHPELSGRENIYMNGTILGMTKKEIDSKLDEIIDFSGVEKYIDTPVKFYSSGMRVRLGFSVAAHLEPEILIIDEVLSVGDYEFQKKCLGKMNEVAKDFGRTVLFVSHNLESVKGLCNKGLLIESGKVAFEGEAYQSVDFYLNKTFKFDFQRVWDYENAPGDDFVKFKRIELVGVGKNGKNYISRDEEIMIQTEFWMVQDHINTNLSLHLYAGTGECIMNIHTQFPTPKLNKGLYSASCIIPSRLLNAGMFSVSILVVKDSSIKLFNFEEAISFEIVEENQKEFSWYGKVPGFIRPDINFEIK
ncbi:ABC transporter ATP-binding protein [Algoriphagus halophilus]|uniref:ABC transporter ATP-binding protein n=1 Tax=Algoriphagus halophilus TaxID=226505 RepID=UPI00358E871F